LTYLTTLDHDKHEALVAADPATERGVVVARSVVASDAPLTARLEQTADDAFGDPDAVVGGGVVVGARSEHAPGRGWRRDRLLRLCGQPPALTWLGYANGGTPLDVRAEWHETAVPSVIPQMRNAVARFAVAAGVLDPPLADVRLAVTEAVTNVVVHSYRRDPAPGLIEIVVTYDVGELRIVVGDRGHGLVPRHDSPGLGLGLGLMAEVSDRFEIRNREPSGTEVHMSFILPQ
jgi:serine/threonine-protein kinase RsbW